MPSATASGAAASCVSAGALRFACENVPDAIRDAEGPALVPPLSLSLGGVPLGPPVPASAHDAGSASFDVPVPAASPDGTSAPAIRWRDVAGNLAADAAFAAPAVRIKASRPVCAVDQSKVTYLRSPWGNAAPEALGGVTGYGVDLRLRPRTDPALQRGRFRRIRPDPILRHVGSAREGTDRTPPRAPAARPIRPRTRR